MGKEGCQECKQTWQKVIYACQISSFIFSIISFVLTRFIKDKGILASSISEELIQNFKSSYFTSFDSSLSDNIYLSELLDETTNDIFIDFDEWKGTLKGCKKSNKITIYEEGDQCDKELPKIFPKKINNYKGIRLKKNDEYEATSYLNLLKNGNIVEKDQDCPNGKKNCGIIDTLGNILCLDTSLDCPINYISVSTKAPTDIPNLKTITGTDANLYYANNPVTDKSTKRYIANSFKIIDDKICIFPSLIYTTFALNDFFVLETSKDDYSTDCDLQNDYTQKYNIDENTDPKRYWSLDQIDNYKLYNENKIIEAITNAELVSEGYNTQRYNDHQLTLIFTIHRGFKLSCVNKEKYEIKNLNGINTKANKMKKYKNYNWLILVNTLTSSTDLFNISGTFIEQLIKNAVSIVDSIAFMIYSYFAIFWDDNYETNTECFDEYTNHLYNTMIDKVKYSGKMIFYCTLFYTILVCINIISLFIRICYKKEN